MAYDYFISRVSDMKLEHSKYLRIPSYWVRGSDKDFKSILRHGELDKFAIFTKDEILQKAKDFQEKFEGGALKHLVNSDHEKAIEHIESYDEAIYLVSAIWWESGLT